MKTHFLRNLFSIGVLFITTSLSASSSTAGTMKAIQYNEYGPPSVLKYVDVPKPIPAAGEVLVRVRAAGVNPVDTFFRRKGDPAALPIIPGFDIAGDVVMLGEGVTNFKIGDAVYGLSDKDDKSGGYAEYTAVPISRIIAKPKNIDHVQAAAVPTPAFTAYIALFDVAKLKAGQTILIHGAAGGVGHFAVQMAKNAGAKVIGTASESNISFMEKLGVDVPIDYRAQKFEDVVTDVDVVFDTVGGDTLKRSYGIIKKGGMVVSIASRMDQLELDKHQIHGEAVNMGNYPLPWSEVTQMLEQGKLKPEIGEIYPLKDAVKAHEKSETRHVRGRLVLKIQDELVGVNSPNTNTMKAIQYSEYGSPSVLKYVDVPKPMPAAGEVLVKVRAAGVNTIDWEIRNGSLRQYGNGLPGIPGFDVAGDVVALGEGVSHFEIGETASDFKIGDAVFARLNKSAGYAEYVSIPTKLLVRKPKNIDYVQAASVPTAAMTAYQALFDAGGLKPGQTVLIHGAGGGVGHFAVQFAKNAGATVIGTGSEYNAAFIKQMGADVFIDYRSQKFEELAKDVDVVLDSIGGDTLKRSYDVVKKGGIIVSIVAFPDRTELNKRGIRGVSRDMDVTNTASLAEIAKLLEKGAIKPEISATFPLQEAAKAHEKSETGHMRGRVVLTIESNQ